MAEKSTSLDSTDKSTPSKSTSQFGKTYTFRLRQHKEPPFRGLWELSLVNHMGRVDKMISDADALNFCIDNLMGELETDGY